MTLSRLALAVLALVLAGGVAVWVTGAPARRPEGSRVTANGQPGTALAPSPVTSPAATPLTSGAGQPAARATAAPSTTAAPHPPRIVRVMLARAPDDPPSILPLTWEASDATQTRLEQPPGPPRAPRDAQMIERMDLAVVATNAGGSVTQPVTLYLLRPPGVEALTTDNPTIQPGQSVRLHWRVVRAERLSLDDQPLGAFKGTLEVSPAATHEYLLRAENGVGETSARLTVEVASPPTSTPLPLPSPTPLPTNTPISRPTLAPTATPLPVATPVPTNPPSLTTNATSTATRPPTPSATPTEPAVATASATSFLGFAQPSATPTTGLPGFAGPTATPTVGPRLTPTSTRSASISVSTTIFLVKPTDTPAPGPVIR